MKAKRRQWQKCFEQTFMEWRSKNAAQYLFDFEPTKSANLKDCQRSKISDKCTYRWTATSWNCIWGFPSILHWGCKNVLSFSFYYNFINKFLKKFQRVILYKTSPPPHTLHYASLVKWKILSFCILKWKILFC